MKLKLCLLTSHDLKRLKRLVASVQDQIPAESIELHPTIVVNTLSDDYYESVLAEGFPFEVVRTESNGKPGKGKNSCHDVFLESDCDYMSQIDGDDILYPTYLLSLEKHIKHFKHIDVLGVVPCDVLESQENQVGYKFSVADNLHVSVWGVSIYNSREFNSGPQRNSYFLDGHNTITDNYIILQSREAAKIRINEEIGFSEDQLFTYQYMSEHINGNLSYFLTMSSDYQIYDRTTQGSMQKVYKQDEWVEEIKREVLKVVPEDRTCFSELPVIYHHLHLNQQQKENWFKDFYNRHRDLF